jgi:GTP cyclohydrolase I
VATSPLDGAGAVRDLLHLIGEDPDRDGLKDTPRRVVKALKEMTAGYEEDPAQILSTTFDVLHDEMIILRGVRFQSLCEHHLLPFVGVAHVGYIPTKRVVGLSKLARLVACYARRLQVQERLTDQVAQAIMQHLRPQGAAVVVDSAHLCMAHRGVRQPDARMVTSCMLGVFRESPEARAEFLRLIE